MDGAQRPSFPEVSQEDEGFVGAAAEFYFIIEKRGGLVRQEGGVGNIISQEFGEPRRVPEQFLHEFPASLQQIGRLGPLFLEALKTFAKFFEVHGSASIPALVLYLYILRIGNITEKIKFKAGFVEKEILQNLSDLLFHCSQVCEQIML